MGRNTKTDQPAFTGKQLLATEKYNNRAARIVLHDDERYTYADADSLIEEFMKKDDVTC